MTDPAAEIVSIYPEGGEAVDPVEAIAVEHRPPARDRPWVMTNMIVSLDGATAIDGLSGGLGGPADLRVFLGLRAVCDVILVGAATAIEEDYRPPSPSADVRRHREGRGQQERPRIAVITRSLSIDSNHSLFADPAYRPLIITTDSAPSRDLDRLGEQADVIIAGRDSVDLPSALRQLSDHGVALLEGGPSLNGQFVAADLVDEWNLTTAPLLAGGSSKRPAIGPALDLPHRYSLARLWSSGGLLFSRWLRDHAPVGS